MGAVGDHKARELLGTVREGDGDIRILRMKRLQERLGVGRSTLYDWMNPKSPRYNPDFPRPIKLSIGDHGAVGWIESEICGWIESRVAASVTILAGREQ